MYHLWNWTLHNGHRKALLLSILCHSISFNSMTRWPEGLFHPSVLIMESHLPTSTQPSDYSICLWKALTCTPAVWCKDISHLWGYNIKFLFLQGHLYTEDLWFFCSNVIHASQTVVHLEAWLSRRLLHGVSLKATQRSDSHAATPRILPAENQGQLTAVHGRRFSHCPLLGLCKKHVSTRI